MGKPEIQLYQAQYHSSQECRRAIDELERKYKYIDETDHFANLVNFSTAKKAPYQRWVRYREGYSTALVEELLRRANISREKHYIADPMAGSGSTILAAKCQGYDTFGIDVNPFCKIIVDAKLLQPTTKTIASVEKFLLELDTIEPASGEIDLPLSDYFPEENLRWLVSLKQRIIEMD